jgi:hypothetical protein
MLAQPARKLLSLFFAASRQAPLVIRGGAVAFCGFGVAPKYQVHLRVSIEVKQQSGCRAKHRAQRADS